jgi:hypothetical protein
VKKSLGIGFALAIGAATLLATPTFAGSLDSSSTLKDIFGSGKFDVDRMAMDAFLIGHLKGDQKLVQIGLALGASSACGCSGCINASVKNVPDADEALIIDIALKSYDDVFAITGGHGLDKTGALPIDIQAYNADHLPAIDLQVNGWDNVAKVEIITPADPLGPTDMIAFVKAKDWNGPMYPATGKLLKTWNATVANVETIGIPKIGAKQILGVGASDAPLHFLTS